MTSKTTYALTIATIAIAAAMLAISPMASQVYGQGLQGKGHTKDTSCTQDGRDLGDECPGKSEKSPNRDECTTIFAGKSDNVKDVVCEEE
jgi:hypothetical protein